MKYFNISRKELVDIFTIKHSTRPCLVENHWIDDAITLQH